MAKPRKLESGRWHIQFMLDGQRHAATFDTARECRAYEREARVQHENREFVAPSKGRQKVGTWLDRWLDFKEGQIATGHFTTGSLRVYRSTVSNHLLPHLGHRTVDSLTVPVVEAWAQKLAREESTHVSASSFRLLSAFCTWLISQGMMTSSSCPFGKGKAQPPVHRTREMHVLEWDELDVLVEEMYPAPVPMVPDADGTLRRMQPDHPEYELRASWAGDVALGLVYIGCRVGDLARLRPEDWDRVNGRLRIWDQKTKKERFIPVFDELERVLRRCVARGGEWLFMTEGQHGQARLNNSAWNRRHLKPALERAGLDVSLRPHDLRHTCATWLHQLGFQAEHIAAYLGHASAATTRRTYIHLFRDDLVTMGSALDEMLKGRRERRSELPSIRKAE